MKTIRRMGIALALGLVAMGSGTVQADPAQLLVVRGSNDQLYKKTCNGTTCSAWTAITPIGFFAAQPALAWDDDTQLYYLYGNGISPAGSIYRLALDQNGNSVGGWALMDGTSPSPIASMGGGLNNNFSAIKSLDMTSVSLDGGGIVNVKSLYITAPLAGFLNCSGAGTIQHWRASATGNDYARVYLAETTGGTQVAWSFTDVPNGTPAGVTSFPFGIERWYSVAAGSKTIYMTAEEGGSAAATTATDIFNASLSCNFHPYSY